MTRPAARPSPLVLGGRSGAAAVVNKQITGDTAAVRIIAGSARGRRLVVPDGTATRPTTDRVREATFNALFSLDMIEGRSFVDLFAGSGALGLEALSRGASSVVFVERDRAALKALRANIETLRFKDETSVIPADSMRWLSTAAHHDVILADPPYSFEEWADLLARATANLLVIESDARLEETPGWESIRERTYGSTVVTILEPLPKDATE